MDAGLNVARINFSHSTHDQHAATIALVREVADTMRPPGRDPRRPAGPAHPHRRPRGAAQCRRTAATLSSCPSASEQGDEIPVTYASLADDVHVGDRMLINDGLIELVVLDVAKPRVHRARAARRRADEPQGHQPARRSGLRAVDHREGPRRHRVRGRAGSRVPRAELRAPRAGHRRAPRADPEVDARRRQDREGLGVREH